MEHWSKLGINHSYRVKLIVLYFTRFTLAMKNHWRSKINLSSVKRQENLKCQVIRQNIKRQNHDSIYEMSTEEELSFYDLRGFNLLSQ